MATEVEFDVLGVLGREERAAIFDVLVDGVTMGQLKISKGGIRWKNSGEHDHSFATWEQFSAFMRDKPRR